MKTLLLLLPLLMAPCSVLTAQGVLFSRSSAFRGFNAYSYGTPGTLAIWHEPRLQSGFANSDPVGTSNDSGPNNYDFTASGGARPTFTTGALNGHPSYDFDGSTDWMSAGDVLDMGTGGLTIMVVCKLDATGGVKTQLAKSLAGDATGRWYLSHVTGNTDALLDVGGSNVAVSYADTSTDWHLLTVVWERGVSLRIYKDGALQDTEALADTMTSFNTSSALLLGAYNNGSDGLTPDPGSYFDGQIIGPIGWSEAFSDATREAAENALGRQYGLTITH